MDIKQALTKLVARIDLSTEEMISVMRIVMTGGATPAQIGGFLVALRMKGETLDEITGAAMVMRELATPVDIDVNYLVDTCGTGGDGANLFNISTASAFVVAAAGGRVAKHGNRSVSSSTGSADVLEAAGIKLDITAEQVARETNLSLRYVQALEQDDYDVLPGPAFIRGYLRRYAQLVQLSPDTLVAVFDELWSSRAPAPVKV